MYIPSKFKCQLSLNLHLDLIEVCATQSRWAKKGVLNLQSYVIRFVSYLPKVSGSLRLPPPLKLTATIWLKVVLNPIQSINQLNITLLGTDSFISVISAWCWISKTLVYPFAIITAGALYVSYRHKLRHKHLLKSIHKFSTSYPMNNIPFLEIKLY
jgi:hypothetical protein